MLFFFFCFFFCFFFSFQRFGKYNTAADDQLHRISCGHIKQNAVFFRNVKKKTACRVWGRGHEYAVHPVFEMFGNFKFLFIETCNKTDCPASFSVIFDENDLLEESSLLSLHSLADLLTGSVNDTQDRKFSEDFLRNMDQLFSERYLSENSNEKDKKSK